MYSQSMLGNMDYRSWLIKCRSHCLHVLQGTAAFIASAWATHAAACRAHGLALLAPSRSLLLAGCVTLWGARLAGCVLTWGKFLKT